MPIRGIKDPPKSNPEDADKINKLDLPAYLDDFMKRRPATESGYISLPKENFKKMVNKASTEKDFETLVNAYANYLGHRNILPQRYIDSMLVRALDMGQPQTMFDMFRFHSELLYHPKHEIVTKYYQYFAQNNYDSLKTFFQTVKDNYLLFRPVGLHTAVIDQAYENGDKDTVLDAYIDILDYEQSGITKEHIRKVQESMSYKEQIDHGLFNHLNKQAERLGAQNDPMHKLYQAIYYYQIKGYLTVVDLFNSIANIQDGGLQNSELAKNELFGKLFSEEGDKIDADVRSQIIQSIKDINDKIDISFYGLADHIKDEVKAPIEEPQQQQQEAVPDQQS